MGKGNQKSKMLSRAAQIENQRKREEKQTLNKVMKMHNAQIHKGMKVLKRKQ
jgi:hypothetical protein